MSNDRIATGLNLTRLGAKLALAASLSSGFTVAVAAPQAEAQTAQAAGRSDSDIQRDVTYALSSSRSLKGQQITAATVEGDVTISGTVRDEASKELAESLLYRVTGVRTVTDNLTVGGVASDPQQGQATSPENTVQGGDPNTASAQNSQDPNYDPAAQNMAPVGPDSQTPDPAQAQNQQPVDPQVQPGQFPQDQSPQARQAYPVYAQNQPPPQPSGPVTVPSGTLLQVRTSEPLDANHSQPGQVFQATVAADIYQGNTLAIPRGAVITGKVVATTTNKGDLAGKQGLSLALTNINLGGQVYSLPSDTWNGQGPGKGGYTASNTVGGAAVGALIGAIAGRGTGAAIGAGVGGAVGATASAATSGPRMYLPPEAVINFHLTAPVTLTPVSAQEAQRLASGSNALQQRQPRPGYRYGYPYGYPPPPPYYYGYRYPVAYAPYYYYGYRY